MVNSMKKPIRIYVEGAGDSKEQRARCREGFSKLVGKAGFVGKMPSFVASGGRTQAFGDFEAALKAYPNEVVLMLVDSEDPVKNLVDAPDDPFAWIHLANRDRVVRPANTENYQALLMATCMETWIATDKEALKKYFERGFQESALPTLPTIETQNRHEVQGKLAHASRNTTKPYQKGSRSFELLAMLDPAVLSAHLSQFRRFVRTLLLLTR